MNYVNVDTLLPDIEEFESRGSTVHTHYDGREIQRTFYLKPASMAPVVAGMMLGKAWTTEEGTDFRTFPARDPDCPECFCNEVKVSDVDPRAIASSNSLELNFPVLSILKGADRSVRFMTKLNKVKDNPAGGCFLTASYRPLITGCHPTYGFDDILESSRDQRFDWINPHFVPSVRTVPWPDGFVVAIKGGGADPWTPVVPDEVAQPVNVPVIEFTVKRLFVSTPRIDLLNKLLNTVNKSTWPTPWPLTADGRGTYVGVPQFPPETLRFDNYELIEHHCAWPRNSDPGGKDSGIWYELVYHFSWISLQDAPVKNEDNELSGDQGLDWVTWNHVLMRPQVPILGDVVPGSPTWRYWDLGWYYVMKTEKPEWLSWPGVTRTVGPIYTLEDFDPLFKLNPFG